MGRIQGWQDLSSGTMYKWLTFYVVLETILRGIGAYILAVPQSQVY